MKTLGLRNMNNIFHTDESIVQAIRKGNKMAENFFYIKYFDPLLRYAYRYTKVEDQAKDFVQETVIKTLLRLRRGGVQISQEGHLLNSMKLTLKYTVYNYTRKQKRSPIIIIDDLLQNIPAQELEALHQDGAVTTAVDSLFQSDTRCHDIVKAKFILKRTMKEIAVEFNISSADYARKLHYKCMEKLRKMAKEELHSRLN